MFATQAGIDACTACGAGVIPNGSVTCRRDTLSTPNGLICTRPVDADSMVWVCGGTIFFASDAPNNSCYEVSWTIVNEGCGVVKTWSRRTIDKTTLSRNWKRFRDISKSHTYQRRAKRHYVPFSKASAENDGATNSWCARPSSNTAPTTFPTSSSKHICYPSH